MSIVVVTGAAGLVGSESVRTFADLGYTVVGIDNDMRMKFFGAAASTANTLEKLVDQLSDSYIHHDADIRNMELIDEIFKTYSSDIKLVVHTAAQPSHDWAATDPLTDFSINAQGSLNLLEAARKHCPDCVFVFCSTNKVYGNTPNRLPLHELPTRWEISEEHRFYNGIDESMSIDASKHSLFGVSKLSADILVQEYGHYFGMKTAVFRAGCLTGQHHAGARLHGFLSYLVRCVMTGKKYEIYGYKGKQVRDNLHSKDLVDAFVNFFQNPRAGEIYNIGGGRAANCSILEAIDICFEVSGKKLDFTLCEQPRSGDHMWWISDNSKFREHFCDWDVKIGIKEIISQIISDNELA